LAKNNTYIIEQGIHEKRCTEKNLYEAHYFGKLSNP